MDQMWILMQGGIRKTKAENAVIMTRAASEELTCKAVFEDMVQDVSVTVAEARSTGHLHCTVDAPRQDGRQVHGRGRPTNGDVREEDD